MGGKCGNISQIQLPLKKFGKSISWVWIRYSKKQQFEFVIVHVQSKEIPSTPAADNLTDALRKGIQFYTKLQTEDGHWGNDYGGPMFLMPGINTSTCD